MSILACLLLPALAPLQSSAKLLPDLPQRFLVDYDFGELQSFWVDVPEDAFAMHVELENPTHPLDLDASWVPDGEYTDHYYWAEDSWYDRSLYIPVTEPFGLMPGRWELDVMVPEDAPMGFETESAEATIRVSFPEPLRGTFREGEVFEATLDRSCALRTILLPEGELDGITEYLVEAYSPAADIDLYVANPLTMRVFGLPSALEYGEMNYERTVLTGDVLKSCEVHVFAHSGSINRPSVPVRVRFTPLPAANATHPPTLVDPPHLPAQLGPAASPQERAAEAALSVFGPMMSGSGSLIGAQGLVLTSAHVIFAPTDCTQPRATRADFEAHTLRGHFAGLPVEPGRAPMPQIGLQLLDYRPDLDLALLRFHGTLDGRPLELPDMDPIPLGDSVALALGDTLFTLGYPMTGGTGKFVSLTLGRGIVSGRAQQLGIASLKTDAPLHSGTSGGLVLNDRWELVGVPDMNIQDHNGAGGIGFAVPIEEIPASWRRLRDAGPLEPIVASLSNGSLVGVQPFLGDDALGLALDLESLAVALGDLDRKASHARPAASPEALRAEAALAQRLPESLGAVVAFARHTPERAADAFALARRIAPGADLPASDAVGPWRMFWDELIADPRAWGRLAALEGVDAERYEARIAAREARAKLLATDW